VTPAPTVRGEWNAGTFNCPTFPLCLKSGEAFGATYRIHQRFEGGGETSEQVRDGGRAGFVYFLLKLRIHLVSLALCHDFYMTRIIPLCTRTPVYRVCDRGFLLPELDLNQQPCD
jgi:hypothetical protein